MIGVVALVGEQPADRAGGMDQGGGHADIICVSGAEQQHPRTPLIVDQAVELGGPAAARAAYPLLEVPPFAPEAERWAFTWVASMEAEE